MSEMRVALERFTEAGDKRGRSEAGKWIRDFEKQEQLRLGMYAYRSKDWNEALGYFEKALKKDSSYGDALFYTALVHHRQGDTKTALDEMRQAAESYAQAGDQHNADAVRWVGALQRQVDAVERQKHYENGISAYDEEDWDAALRYFKRAQKIDPGHVETLYYLGLLYHQQADYQAALHEMRAAEAAYEQAGNRRWQSRAGELAEQYQKLVDANARDKHYADGVAAFDKEKWDEAVKHLEKAYEHDSEHPETLFYLAMARQKTGDFRDALEKMQRAHKQLGRRHPLRKKANQGLKELVQQVAQQPEQARLPLPAVVEGEKE
jgi:tetratricopeptide (TPR) repeat protein